MSSQRIRRLANDYKSLTQSIDRDMDLIVASATKCKELLKDSPELIDDAFKKSSVESLKTLYVTSGELESELSTLEDAFRHPGTDGLAKTLETIFKHPPRLDASPDKSLKLRQLERIFSSQRTASSLTSSPSKRSKKRKSSGQGPSGADLEVVEETENRIHMDPLSLLPIKVLVQNKRCKHYYCYETIQGHIKTGPYPRCPIAGCSLPHIREDDLVFID